MVDLPLAQRHSHRHPQSPASVAAASLASASCLCTASIADHFRKGPALRVRYVTSAGQAGLWITVYQKHAPGPG